MNVKKGDEDWGWGLSINFNKKKVNMRSRRVQASEVFLLCLSINDINN